MASASPSKPEAPGKSSPAPAGPLRRAVFLAALTLAGVAAWFKLAGTHTTAACLGLGVLLALLHMSAWPKHASLAARLLIQASIVVLGLTVDLHKVAQAGVQGVAFAIATIGLVFVLGSLLGRALGSDPKMTAMLNTGTSICGGSAIAATAPVIGATSSQTAVALGAVFLLNAVALVAFPPLGHWLGLTPQQFGVWAGVAIHDVASVVGAASGYDAAGAALEVATPTKLARVLWIAPAVAIAAWLVRRELARAAGNNQAANGLGAKPRTPLWQTYGAGLWYLWGFLIAASIRTALPDVEPRVAPLVDASKAAMAVALFLIGCGMNAAALRAVGWRTLIQAVAVWVALALVSLAVVKANLGGAMS